ncbi:HAD-IIIC family phosphatase [Psychrobacillus sp. NPDC096623]|uniref:HAD-IIIC family phosphatase n=1 Tax=Psychrobacillus sp. NPDC096623 TaxID=3364492 RepID=UPI003805D6F7
MKFQFDKFLIDMNKLNQIINLRQLKKEYVQIETNIVKKVEVVRTLPFEYIESMLSPFTQIWDTQAHFSYSDYDTALSQIASEENSDIRIVWMDWRLYVDKMSPRETVDWVINRIKAGGQNKPVLINNWPAFLEQEEQLLSPSIGRRNWFRQLNDLLQRASEEITMLEIIDLDFLASKKGIAIYDLRNDQISNYPFSNNFTVDIARHMGLQLFPAIFRPRLKVIIMDLDNTMYSGVLGEDGYDGIRLKEEHIALQKTLLSLKQSGIILAISSKNEHADVVELFNKRKDFLLTEQDFTFIKANWQDKASNISSIIQRINIDASAVLFVDDNMAEITQVKTQLPNLHVILADVEGKETFHRLLNYPGLYTLKHDAAANLRQDDILANQKRDELLASATNETAYLETLKMKIEIHENNPDHVQRVYELSNKTNQFNLALKRYSLNEVEHFINDKQIRIYTIGLSDILSNSGIIGIFVCKLQDKHVIITETLFSCRALGRLVESSALLHILNRLKQFGVESISFDFSEGPKNKPGLDWLLSLEVGEKQEIAKVQSLLENRLALYTAEVLAHYE